MTIQSDIQSLSPSGKVVLYVLDATSIGGSLLYFHGGLNELKVPVTWQGQVYQAWPIEVTGVEWNGRGQAPRPQISAGNLSGVLSALVLTYDDLVGAKLIRKTTMVKYLDAVNFTGGVNASADPNAHLPDEVYYINRKTHEDNLVVQWELGGSFDVTGVKLPRRIIIQNVCPTQYKSAECGWVPSVGHYFKADDTATTVGLDSCGKRLSSCKVRFGSTAQLPYGGFPTVGVVK